MTQSPLHDANGNFARGNPGGPGRPTRRTEDGYLALVMRECGFEQWRAIVRRAVEDAQDGDDRARAWLSGYLLGAPRNVAPTLTAVVVNQLLGADHALDLASEKLAAPAIEAERFPSLHKAHAIEDGLRDQARAMILEKWADNPEQGCFDLWPDPAKPHHD